MRRAITLRNGLVLIVVAALLPIGTLSVVQALSTLDYSRNLIGNGLVTSALATAAIERDSIAISKQVLIRMSANSDVLAGNAGCVTALKTGLGESPALINLARSDAMGRVRCSILPFEAGMTFATEPWWQRGITESEFTLSTPVFGSISKKRILVGMLPVKAPDGSYDGAITAAIDATWLEQSLSRSEISPNAAIAIVDQKGMPILTNETRPLPHFDVQRGRANVAEATASDRVRWTYSVAPLYENALFVVYAEPTRHLMAKAVRQVRVNLLLPIAALLLASFAIWVGANRLVLRWLAELRVLADQFAQGNFTGDYAKFARAPRELGLLSADMHGMAYDIESRDQELKAALVAKTALTHDIHHRVKNNLQIVSSLLTLQAAKITDPAARDALAQTRARIGALAQIHRLLYEESHDSDHGNVNISSLLNALCIQLRALHRGQYHAQLICHAASQAVPINNAVPLSLLAVEAITNAYRHGFAAGEHGTINVHFDVVGDEATLSITDDGAGYDISEIATSMGGQLMEAFAQQLGGSLDITSTAGAGTVVTLRYPGMHEIEQNEFVEQN